MKFSIRDLLLVTMIVAILAAWWVDRSRLAKEVQELRKIFNTITDLGESDLDTGVPASEAPSRNSPAK